MIKRIRKMFNGLFSVAASVIVGLVFAWILRECLIFNAIVPSASMYPTIAVGDLLIGSRLAYAWKEPQRGDIVTFPNLEAPEETCLKRVIGLPGEVIEIVDGKVYINGNTDPLDEPYVNSEDPPVGDFGPYEIPEGFCFVMGDNRNNSFDSRFWSSHFVAVDSISSQIIFQYFPNFKILE